MAHVEIRINGRDYKVTCDNGQEPRLEKLAAYFDKQVSQIGDELGQIGDARLMLLAALTVCDELFEAKARAESLENAADEMDAETIGGASRAIEAAVSRVNAIAEKLDQA